MSDLKKGRNQRHERIDMKGRGKWTGWKRWNEGEEVANGREELNRFKAEGTTYREQKGRVETKEVANGITKSWNERKEATNGREELQQKDGRNEKDELTGKEEQEEQDRRFERNDGLREMNAFKWEKEVNE